MRLKIIVLLCTLALALPGSVAQGWTQTAENQDFALFYEALAPYGKWIDYGNYGVVWYPTGVSEDWRPYLNGRWVPTEEGWVFETEEPWGWATYHYGNWFPTIEYGWVWSPGSTWYPSTAVWRTSDDYIGWAPLPPANYEPVPAFYPEGGYYTGAPLWDLLTPAFWTFCPSSSFLLGFGSPYLPSYSYWNCGCLAPFAWNPFLAFRTYFLPDFFFPSFAPHAFFAFGPAFPFVARVTNINVIVINKFVKDKRFIDFKNALPPKVVLDRHPFLRKTIPDPVFQGQKFQVSPVKDVKLAQTNLLRPNVTPLPVGVPKVSREIPKAIALPHRRRVGPEALLGVKGMGLPEKAVRGTAVKAPAVQPTQPTVAAPSLPTPPRGQARMERREDAGASMIEVLPPGRRAVTPSERQIRRGIPQPTRPEEAQRRQQQEQLRTLEQRQQRMINGQRQEREQLQQRQLRQQEVLRDQQRVLEQRHLRQQEGLQRQREQLRLQQQLEQRQLRRQQQIRQQPSPPQRLERRPQPRRSSSSIRSGSTGPRGRSLVAPRSGSVRSASGRSVGTSRGGGSGSSRSMGMGFGRIGR